MKTRLLIGLLSIFPIVNQHAFGCSRDLTPLFWSPIIDKVSGDCSFVGFEINPSGIIFTTILGTVICGFIYWRKRK